MSDQGPPPSADESWKNKVLPEINVECLQCIRQVEEKYNNATPSGCINHEEWTLASPLARETCGSYSISELYYSTCSEKIVVDVHTNHTWDSCAKEDSCSSDCVSGYVNSDRTVSCDRGSIANRLCVDYGIIHAFGVNACVLRDDNPDINKYASWMEKECGVDNPVPASQQKTTTVKAEPVVPALTIVVPIAASTLVLVLIMIGVICFIKRKKRLLLKEAPGSSRSANNYGSDPGSSGMRLNFLASYELDQCSPVIQEMVKGKLISITDVEVLEEIGRGQFGVIRKAHCYTSSEHTHKITVAVKLLRNQQAERYEEEVQNLLREAHIMSQFDNVNVLNLIGVIWERGEQPAVVCPYMGKGSLLDLIKKSEIKFTELDLLNFVVQIAAGLEYLEVMKFVHRDIALRNCLVSDLYVVKISDFGLTRDIYDSRIYECNDVTEKRLPWKWLAPECIKQGSFTHKSDAWSFGVTIWELYADGSSPYPAIGNLTVLQDCLEAGYRLSKPDKLSQPLYDLMRLMWNAEPSFRPAFSELQAAIKLQITNASDQGDYSYTMQSSNDTTNYTETDENVQDYMQPLSRSKKVDSRGSNIYADASGHHEPDIYS